MNECLTCGRDLGRARKCLVCGLSHCPTCKQPLQAQRRAEYSDSGRWARNPEGTDPAMKPKRPGQRLALCLFFAVLLFSAPGCTSNKIMTSVNNYAYHVARVNEAPDPCKHAKLERWRAALDEVNAASKRGGSFPLQLQALKAAETKFGECK